MSLCPYTLIPYFHPISGILTVGYNLLLKFLKMKAAFGFNGEFFRTGQYGCG
jgi:hypothetical protein